MTTDLNNELTDKPNKRPGKYSTFKPKNKSRRWKYVKPDIQKQCLICDTKFKVKYILPKQQYSLKNNWGYWTDKETNQHKYLCDACLVKILNGKRFDAFDWIPANKAANFRSYLARGILEKMFKGS